MTEYHIVTMRHHVKADSWDLAVEGVIAEPLTHLVAVTVKPPRKRLVHLPVSALKEAVARKEQP